METRHTIYALVDPKTGVFYVGQTIDLKKRIRTHFVNSHNPLVNEKIKSIIDLGYNPEVKILGECCLDEVDSLEQYWIDYYNRVSDYLLNKKPGSKQKPKDILAKQAGVVLDAEIQLNETYQERVKYISFSQYVKTLIRKDIGL